MWLAHLCRKHIVSRSTLVVILNLICRAMLWRIITINFALRLCLHLGCDVLKIRSLRCLLRFLVLGNWLRATISYHGLVWLWVNGLFLLLLFKGSFDGDIHHHEWSDRNLLGSVASFQPLTRVSLLLCRFRGALLLLHCILSDRLLIKLLSRTLALKFWYASWDSQHLSAIFSLWFVWRLINENIGVDVLLVITDSQKFSWLLSSILHGLELWPLILDDLRFLAISWRRLILGGLFLGFDGARGLGFLLEIWSFGAVRYTVSEAGLGHSCLVTDPDDSIIGLVYTSLHCPELSCRQLLDIIVVMFLLSVQASKLRISGLWTAFSRRILLIWTLLLGKVDVWGVLLGGAAIDLRIRSSWLLASLIGAKAIWFYLRNWQRNWSWNFFV